MYYSWYSWYGWDDFLFDLTIIVLFVGAVVLLVLGLVWVSNNESTPVDYEKIRQEQIQTCVNKGGQWVDGECYTPSTSPTPSVTPAR